MIVLAEYYAILLLPAMIAAGGIFIFVCRFLFPPQTDDDRFPVSEIPPDPSAAEPEGWPEFKRAFEADGRPILKVMLFGFPHTSPTG